MFGRKTGSSLTYINSTTEIQGNLNVEGNLRVDGSVYGLVHVKGDMELAQTGLIEGAELKARNLMIHGTVKARIVAEGRLTLGKTARLEGDVKAHSLEIEPGATYVGYIDTALENLLVLPLAPRPLTESEDTVRS
jgi:cytoskeletal protein CcmA (bactofilin family)